MSDHTLSLSRRRFLKGSLALVLASIGGYAYSHHLEPSLIETVTVPLTLPNLAPEFHGYRIVQVSDIHMGTWITREHLQNVTAMVNQLKPDLIALTGDYLNYARKADVEDLVAGLKDLRAKDGTTVVMGNHDYWSDSEMVRGMIRATGMIDVNNDVYTLERGDTVLHIAGVDDFWEGHTRLDLVLKRLPKMGAAILLAHEPDFADASAATGRFDLQLSGHSHGGQVVFPYLGAPIVPPFSRKYPSGQYQVDRMIQYTNRGIGLSRFQYRLNCPPEITVFSLQSPQV